MPVKLRVFIVRHGETAANKDGTIQGQLDTELNEEGLRQARLLAEKMKETPIHIAYSSDLIRAKKTAEIVLEHHPGVALHERKELRERFMGTLEGTRVPGIARQAIMRSDKTIETTEQLGRRALAWWDEVIKHVGKNKNTSKAGGEELELEDADANSWESAAQTTNILVTSHGGTISTFFNAGLAQGRLELGPGVVFTRYWNTSVSIVEVDETRRGRVTQYADVSHLAKEQVRVTNADEVEIDARGVEEQDAPSAVTVSWRAEPIDSRPHSRNI